MELAPFLMPLVTAIGLLVGLHQYVKAQRWKRCEFTAAQIKAFEDNSLVRRAMFMLDFSRGTFVGDGCAAKSCTVDFDTEILTAAIAAHTIKPGILTDEEIHIRLAFCDFFEGIERFEYFARVGLISLRDLDPYLTYWIRLFASADRKNNEFIHSVWTFIDAYAYTGVRRLATKLAQREQGLIVPTPERAQDLTRAWFRAKITSPKRREGAEAQGGAA